jgi:transposase
MSIDSRQLPTSKRPVQDRSGCPSPPLRHKTDIIKFVNPFDEGRPGKAGAAAGGFLVGANGDRSRQQRLTSRFSAKEAEMDETRTMGSVSRRLRRWRGEHGGPGRRIPEELWQMAAEVACVEGVEVTARALRLDRARLARHVETWRPPAAAATAPVQYIELGASEVEPTGQRACVEVSTAGGDRLRIEVVGGVDLATWCGPSRSAGHDAADASDAHPRVHSAGRLPCALSAEEHQVLEAFTEQSLWVLQELEAAELTLAKLRRELFGSPSEKTRDVLSHSNGEAPTDATNGADETSLSENDSASPEGTDDGKPKAKGHGRNGADAYTGAERVCTEHETLQPSDICPACRRGKLYRMKRPAVRIRVTGGAPIRATVFEQQRLRCNTCGEVFTARAPPEAQGQRYDARAAAMIAMLRYGTGLPFNRLDRLQGCLAIPLPSSTQWEVVEKAADDIFAVYEELIRQSADAQLLHNDDTKMPVLSLTGKRRAKEAPQDDPPDRTGMFTTGIVAVGEQFRAPVFCTGRRHAGENLQAVLDRRAAELGMPKLMCDGLDRNLPATTKVELINLGSTLRCSICSSSQSFRSLMTSALCCWWELRRCSSLMPARRASVSWRKTFPSSVSTCRHSSGKRVARST